MDTPKPTDRPDALRRALTLSALGAAGTGGALGLVGCGGDDNHNHNHDNDNDNDNDNGGRDPVAILRFVNGTNVNPLDFRLNGETVFTGLQAGGQVSTYGDVFAGNTVLAVRAPSGPPDLATIATTLVVDRFTSAVAHGGLGGTGIKLTVFEETNAQPATGSTRIRLFHAASNIPGRLNVYFSS